MAVSYTDDQIGGLVGERKPLPADWQERTRMKRKRGHDEQYLDLSGETGTEFRLILRQSRINRLDFSVILAVLVPQSTQVFRLRRYNGRSHEHTNQIEKETFYDFHIHFATERYQALGAREDAYQPVAKVPAAFERRCIPPDCVAPRSNMPNILPRRALSGGRLAALGATRGFTTGCYARPTDRYGTFHDALDCLFTDTNVSVPPKAQGELFDLVGGLG